MTIFIDSATHIPTATSRVNPGKHIFSPFSRFPFMIRADPFPPQKTSSPALLLEQGVPCTRVNQHRLSLVALPSQTFLKLVLPRRHRRVFFSTLYGFLFRREQSDLEQEMGSSLPTTGGLRSGHGLFPPLTAEFRDNLPNSPTKL